MEENKRIVEINGVKFEVDLRECKVVEQYKVGDNVKVLKKEYNDYKSYLGVVIGFDDFKNHPTMIVAYLKADYSAASVEFVYFNSENKEVEICPLNTWDIALKKSDIIRFIDRDIAKKEEELREINTRKEVFLTLFGKYFENKTE
jgi:hypothetical protein